MQFIILSRSCDPGKQTPHPTEKDFDCPNNGICYAEQYKKCCITTISYAHCADAFNSACNGEPCCGEMFE